jgi:hypothetical protein
MYKIRCRGPTAGARTQKTHTHTHTGVCVCVAWCCARVLPRSCRQRWTGRNTHRRRRRCHRVNDDDDNNNNNNNNAHPFPPLCSLIEIGLRNAHLARCPPLARCSSHHIVRDCRLTAGVTTTTTTRTTTIVIVVCLFVCCC